MIMMRNKILFLLGIGVVMTGYSQTMLDDSTAPISSQVGDENSELSIGMDQIQTPGPEVDILGNDAESLAGLKENTSTNEFGDVFAEKTIETNNVTESKVGFLLSTGIEYSGEGEYEEAEKAYLRALSVDEQNPEILFRLGNLYVNMERLADAAEIFKKLVQRFPDNPLPRNNLAWCYATGAGIKNATLALRYAREALLSAPLNPSVWNTLAECYYVAGDYDKALRSSEYAFELLLNTKPAREMQEQFLLQREKIIRAQKARDVMEGLDEEK
jgi:tetratricopeptide (TPR) repeat protein